MDALAGMRDLPVMSAVARWYVGIALFFLMAIGPAGAVPATDASDAVWSDSFVSPYALWDGETSPDGNWYCAWAGYGQVGTQDIDGDLAMRLRPAQSMEPSVTHSSLAVSLTEFQNALIEVDVRTSVQLRLRQQGRRWRSKPNPWEVAWLLFRVADTSNFYYFAVKPNGCEFGKLEGGVQKILWTAAAPKLTIGRWDQWTVSVTGSRTTVWVNGAVAMDYMDFTAAPALASGSVGLYCEDADVQFDNVRVTRL